MNREQFNRKEFLKKIGLGSLGVAWLGASAGTAAAGGVPGMGDGHQFWSLLAFSKGATIGDVDHRIGMNGAGTVKPSVGHAGGGGGFFHIDWEPPNSSVIAFGTWEVRRFLDYIDGFGDFAVVRASILELEIELNRQFPSPATIPATLRIICNVGPAGISTGEDEGFKLAIPSATPPSPFVPLVPALGLTVISTPGSA